MAAHPNGTKAITLALQGGGSHGAYTWGVLNRLLDDERLTIKGISGTSAGAMNAVILADGMEKGGRQGAKDALHAFWKDISEHGSFSPYNTAQFNPLGADWSPLAFSFDIISQLASPYQLNPLNINPLRDVLKDRQIDFKRLKASKEIKLFISATNVKNNHLRIFTNKELSEDVLMASACLPSMHQAVEIKGQYYWDGGFMGNPALEPLIRKCKARDILIVQLNPTVIKKVPTLAHEIADRLNEITFNATLMREICTYALITRLVERGRISDPQIERAYFHLIAFDDAFASLGVRSKFDTGWPFLTQLEKAGRENADKWLAENFAHLGNRSSIDLEHWSPIEGS